MKKAISTLSPFIMLLIPVFVCVGLVLLNDHTSIPAEGYNAKLTFHLPAINELIKTMF
ncbi:hypothetical protein GS399_11580 [Pedobacter sp. HMF7647]|uniref:Uncharacterized protein n=1 Tax=Hufsiella arboris TaxID=2695275 RepID=A0A7K1YAL2_9SPHI|nr:hypothetical protein [Hufsiella arboris]MXV51613.1 hypothetical protein [Hufsiella arboris]